MAKVIKNKAILYLFCLFLLEASTSNLQAQWLSSTPNIYFNTGYVGIGTSTMTSRLTLNTAGWANSLELNNGSGFSFRINAATDGLLFKVNGSYTTAGVFCFRSASDAHLFEIFPDGHVNTKSALHIGYNNTGDIYGHLSSAGSYPGSGLKFDVASAGSTTGFTSMTIANTGNVGIGTTNPSLAKLQVEGDIKIPSANFYGFTDGSTKLYSSYLYSAESFTIKGWNGSAMTSNVTFQTLGNVGIGTTNPLSKLGVNGGVAVGTYAGVNAAPSNGMILSGNVGIGTSDPKGQLSLDGPGADTEPINFHIGGAQVIARNSYYTNDGIWHYSKPGTAFTIAFGGGDETGGSDMVFDYAPYNSTIGASVTWNHAMRISSSGNIVVGTLPANATGTYLFNVGGRVRANEVVVNTDGADFVFEEGYNLTPLNELESFIKENKHLPEIASAKEVEENGVKLGEMNTKLLQKIEELTLYIIDQNKRIRTLEENYEKSK